MDGWLAHEPAIRYYALIGSFGIVAVWEAFRPRRDMPAVRGRWSVNIGLTLLLSVLVGFAFPVLTVGAALAAERAGAGLLNVVSLPPWAAFVVALLAIDFTRYLIHVALHRVPWLWRLHRVHHSDTDFDCTTALRFHPVEAFLTVGAQIASVVALGAPPLAVLAYEAINAFVSFFSHANVALRPRTEALLRRLVVTPDLHRVHHSALRVEAEANFGVLVPWWDRLFRTYRDQPAAPHTAMAIGLADVRDARVRRFTWLLAAPFRRIAAGA